jgi:hypothetical protein
LSVVLWVFGYVYARLHVLSRGSRELAVSSTWCLALALWFTALPLPDSFPGATDSSLSSMPDASFGAWGHDAYSGLGQASDTHAHTGTSPGHAS